MSSDANSPLQPANRATSSATARVWSVGALCHAVADTLDARFGAVRVQGEIAGFMRAASGHCYFTLKDAQGQLRCAMFRRAANLLGWEPRDGDQIEVSGRLAVYEARGDLQLIVESMRRAGQGALYEAFLRIKAELEAQGLFDAARKRPLTPFPRGLGLVSSLGRQPCAMWPRPCNAAPPMCQCCWHPQRYRAQAHPQHSLQPCNACINWQLHRNRAMPPPCDCH